MTEAQVVSPKRELSAEERYEQILADLMAQGMTPRKAKRYLAAHTRRVIKKIHRRVDKVKATEKKAGYKEPTREELLGEENVELAEDVPLLTDDVLETQQGPL